MLESVQYRGQHVGVLPSGEIREPGRTGTGQHAQFRLIQHKKPEVSINSVCLQINGPSSPDTNDAEESVYVLMELFLGNHIRERSVLLSGVSLEGG